MANVLHFLMPCIVAMLTSATMDLQSKKQLAALVEKYTIAQGAAGCCFSINPGDSSQLVGFEAKGKGKSVIAPAKLYKHDDNSFEMGLIVTLSPAENTDARKIYPAAIAKKDLDKDVIVRTTVKITGSFQRFAVAPINKDNVIVEVGGEIVKKDAEAAKYATFVDHATAKIQKAFQTILNQPEDGEIWSTALKLVPTLKLQTPPPPLPTFDDTIEEKYAVPYLSCFTAHWKKKGPVNFGAGWGLGFNASPQLTGFDEDAAMKIVDGHLNHMVKIFAFDFIAVYKADDNKAGRAKFPSLVANLAKGKPLKIQTSAFVFGSVGFFHLVSSDSRLLAAYIDDKKIDPDTEPSKYKALVDATMEHMTNVLKGFLGQSASGPAW